MQRHSREYWKEQLREYWGSGFTVSEYSELIGQPRLTVKRWIRKLRPEYESSEIIEQEQECPVRMICQKLSIIANDHAKQHNDKTK